MSIPPPLTIRNLTSTPTELRLVERYAPPPQSDNGASFLNITRSLSSLLKTSSSELAAISESFNAKDVSITVGQFETKTTDIQVNAQEILRLTFENNGQRYRLDTPPQSSKSTVLTPLSPNPQAEYTAVYLPAHSHIAIFSSANLASWMAQLKDELPLSVLSIPGTHNSPTHYTALPSVRCQAVSVLKQLENGVRFLDIRVQPEYPEDPSKAGLLLVHSAFPISLTGNKYFAKLVDDIRSFLDANPSETVIMSLKREGIGRSTDQQLSRILRDHYMTDANFWFTENRIPTLGEARKKIIVIRRFVLDDALKGENDGAGWCIDAESWPDNCADGTCSSGEIRVQDFYEVEETINIDQKITFSEAQLGRAAACVAALPEGPNAASAAAARQPFFFNFLSAANFFRPGCWPDRIAARVNPHIVDFLCRKHNEPSATGGPAEHMGIGDGSTGIVVCDWVGNRGDWDLVRCIVGMNAKLEMREKRTQP
ncbi:MAG: hypothetical protein M1818_006657 [Claussenomyces sp. TS43310]|nr:MAG: hypothetical protein M1818_006910 [Claussenomyces sp. TS43310]KAI9735080.1 MAG: hypothetical protein M1818_006657 [Claussenomyces sp. TS43310]